MKKRIRGLFSIILAIILGIQLFGLEPLRSIAADIYINSEQTIDTESDDSFYLYDGGTAVVTGKGNVKGAIYGSGGVIRNSGTIKSIQNRPEEVYNYASGSIDTLDTDNTMITNEGRIQSIPKLQSLLTNSGMVYNLNVSTGSVENTGDINILTLTEAWANKDVMLQMNGGTIGKLNVKEETDSFLPGIRLSAGTIGICTGHINVMVDGAVNIGSFSGNPVLSGEGSVTVTDVLHLTGDYTAVTPKLSVTKTTTIRLDSDSRLLISYKDQQYTLDTAGTGTLSNWYGHTVTGIISDQTGFDISGSTPFTTEKSLYGDTVTAEYKAADGYYFPDAYQAVTLGTGKLVTSKKDEQTVAVSYTVGAEDKDKITVTLPAVMKKTEKKKGSGSVTVSDTYYGIKPKAIVRSATNGTKAVVVEYKKKGADDQTYSKTVPSKTGTYTVRATFPETDIYTEAVAVSHFTIAYLPIPKTPAYTIAGTRGENGYYTSDISLIPLKGYQISMKRDGIYGTSIALGENTKLSAIYLMRSSDGARTDAIHVGTYKIDKTKPAMSLQNNAVYYASLKNITVSDRNLDQVYVNGKKQTVTGTTCTIQLSADYESEDYTIKAVDRAGNTKTITVTIAEEWMKTGVIPADKQVRLRAGKAYQLDSGTWSLQGDTTSYAGNRTIYVENSGYYTFSRK